MFKLIALLSVLLAPIAATASPDYVLSSASPGGRLRATDVNGIRLDMTLAEVNTLARDQLNSLGFNQYSATIDGVQYRFGFTPLLRLYEIHSSTPLGRFSPNDEFYRAVSAKLTAKYGPTRHFWERWSPTPGEILLRQTQTVSVLLGGDLYGPRSLDIDLLDFRILRRDLAASNAGPQAKAEAAVKF
jgi:hypothetical protein